MNLLRDIIAKHTIQIDRNYFIKAACNQIILNVIQAVLFLIRKILQKYSCPLDRLILHYLITRHMFFVI